MRTLACDRCFKIKGENDEFATIMIASLHYDLCEACYERFKMFSKPYEKAITDIEMHLINEQMRFVHEFRHESKDSNN